MTTAAEDIVDNLLAQHQQIKTLFAQVAAAEGPHKEELFNELVALLAVHESVEESLVHPLAEDKLPDGEDVVPPRLAEEQEAKEELAALYDLGVEHPDFDLRLAALRDAVTAHAEAEEELEFSRLREVIDADRLTKMTSSMRAVAAMSPTRPHPNVSPTAPANLLLGPPLAVFDRVRDALRNATKEA